MAFGERARLRGLLTCALALVILGAVSAVGAGLAFLFQPFGNRVWTFGSVMILLIAAAWGIRRHQCPGRVEGAPARRRTVRFLRWSIMEALVVWLALITWSALSPAGALPPPKQYPAGVRVLTWNILLGTESRLPWMSHGWPVRKAALATAVQAVAPDILCVQEALEGQIKFLEAALPRHRRMGVGRDDGQSAGEFCAIYFDAERFQRLDSGTFWLEKPFDAPPEGARIGPKRICTWVRLQDGRSGRTFRVYNTHLYLTEPARSSAVREILARIQTGNPSDAVLVAGDFNATADAASRRLFVAAGLRSASEPTDGAMRQPTYQFYGIRTRSLDDFYISRGWRIRTYRILDVKPGNTFPSDHFGVMADVSL
jgi:endonuclease/exonuclease/phosphatase family metal-dependent hydrolase